MEKRKERIKKEFGYLLAKDKTRIDKNITLLLFTSFYFILKPYQNLSLTSLPS